MFKNKGRRETRFMAEVHVGVEGYMRDTARGGKKTKVKKFDRWFVPYILIVIYHSLCHSVTVTVNIKLYPSMYINPGMVTPLTEKLSFSPPMVDSVSGGSIHWNRTESEYCLYFTLIEIDSYESYTKFQENLREQNMVSVL